MLSTDTYDVAVVGFGPVGAVLGALLGRRGHSVIAIERHPAVYPLPRAVHFDHEVARILQSCGLGSELGAISEPADEYEWRNGSGDVLLRFVSHRRGASGWPESNMFWQPSLEDLTERAATTQPGVDLRRGWQLEHLEQEADAVRLTVRRTKVVQEGDGRREAEPTGGTETIRARYVVGCDGANSTVRDLIGVAMTDLGFYYDWLIVDVALHQPRAFDPPNVQICDPARPTTAVSGGPGRRRWEFMRLPHESIEELNDAAKAWELLADWDVSPRNATLERHAVYTFQARWAEEWRAGRVFLAGDAAHQTPPFAGQGMCAGLRDAANLAWKLDLVLGGKAPEALLDAYAIERRANARALIEFAVELGKVICVADNEEAARRDELMAAAMAESGTQAIPAMPGLSGGVVVGGDPLAGSLFVQGRVAAGDCSARFDDVVGAGWRLISIDPDVATALPAAEVAWFEDLGGRVVILGVDVEDIDGTYKSWFGDHGVSTVLQRPDFYLFGAATDCPGAAGLLAGLRDALGAGTTTRAGGNR